MQYNREIVCFINEPCTFPVHYSYETVGDTVYLTDFFGDQEDKDNAVASSTLENNFLLLTELDLPIVPITIDWRLCLLLDRQNTDEDYLHCDITIKFVIDNTESPFELYDCENVCEGLSTTTLLGDLQCAAYKTGCWALVPRESSLKKVTTAIKDVENSFPFNTLFSLLNITNDVIMNTTSTDDTLGVPWINESGDFYIQSVLASTSLPNAIGQENATMIQNGLGWFAWILVMVIIAVQLL